jgi:DOPA 4,5-dioxygenase
MDDIRGFHAHVYFDAATGAAAEQLRDALARRFDVKLGTMHERPVGPHSKAMFQVNITTEQFATVVPWLMLNRVGLTVLVHPVTNDPVADHDTHPLWMGEPIPIDVELLRRMVAAKAKEPSGDNDTH